MTSPIVEIIMNDPQTTTPSKKKLKKKSDQPEKSPEEAKVEKLRRLQVNRMLSDKQVAEMQRPTMINKLTDLECERIAYKFSQDAHAILMSKRAQRAKGK